MKHVIEQASIGFVNLVNPLTRLTANEKVVLHLRSLRRIITFGNFGGRDSDNVDSSAGGIVFYPSELSCQFDIKKGAQRLPSTLF